MPAGTPVQVRLPDEERDALDEYRRQKSNPPTRGQAARELIQMALSGRLDDTKERSRPAKGIAGKLSAA